MRHVLIDIKEISFMDPKEKNEYVTNEIPKRVSAVLDDIIAALTSPLTPEEEKAEEPIDNTPRIVVKGSLEDVNKYFYQRSWSYGMPIVPPTEEAVKAMLEGTDLPPDHVVAKVPPMKGKATVEKIAINGVMAGCLPIHMPVLIAAVEALVDPRIWMEAYTISVASWAPLLIVNGPIRHDLDISCGNGCFSPYNRANAAIGHTLGLLIMNLGGVRKGFEDKGIFGHEGHFGMCIGENEEESPWEPWHQFCGFDKEDSAVSIFWPNSREFMLLGRDPEPMLRTLCERAASMGFDPGCAFIFCPEAAQTLADFGFSRQHFRDYMVEYARRPAHEINVGWMRDNNHELPGIVLPAEPTRLIKKFFSDKHLPVIVSGMSYGNSVCMYGGGGDHGGPVTHRINLPKNWKGLVEKYKDYRRVEEYK